MTRAIALACLSRAILSPLLQSENVPMESGVIRISEKEIARHHVLRMVLEGRTTIRDAAVRKGVSYRHAKRVAKSFRERGVKGVLHGNRDRPAWNRTTDALRARIVELSVGSYSCLYCYGLR